MSDLPPHGFQPHPFKLLKMRKDFWLNAPDVDVEDIVVEGTAYLIDEFGILYDIHGDPSGKRLLRKTGVVVKSEW